jgi:glycosyltransferase involved in cell wall biosynthesis
MNKPLFSVVIPTYNRGQKLLRGLRSLNNQTFSNFEVLVCDDGSTDDTKEVVDNFRPGIKFRQLSYFFEPNWGGPARPRNRGINEAAGDWICFLDSDDAWYPEKLENTVPYLENYDLIYHDFDLVSDSGKPKPLKARQLHYPVFEDLMLKGHNGCIINSGVCVRKTTLIKAGYVNEDRILISVEDADLWLKIARITDRFKHLPKRLGMYFLDGGNITIYNQQMIDKLEYLFDLHAAFLKNDRLKISAARTNNYHLARIRQMMGNSKEALKLHHSSLGSPNIKLAVRSFYWIFYIYLRSKISRSSN